MSTAPADIPLPADIWPQCIRDVLVCRSSLAAIDKSPAAVAAVMLSIHATLTRLARKLLGDDSEDAADQLAGEYIRFMLLRATEQPTPVAAQPSSLSPSLLVDQLWHAHLLETYSYAQMCVYLVPGGCTIHHSSLRADQAGRSERLQRTLEQYSVRFQAPAPPAVWDEGHQQTANFEWGMARQQIMVASSRGPGG